MSSSYAALGSLVYLIIPIVMLVAAIVAHRGKSFWATWLMIIGSSGLILAIALMAGAMFFTFQNLSRSGGSGSTASAMSSGIIFSIIGGLCGFGGFLAYGVGLIGLCVRWGPTARRAATLEELTTSLISERSQARE